MVPKVLLDVCGVGRISGEFRVIDKIEPERLANLGIVAFPGELTNSASAIFPSVPSFGIPIGKTCYVLADTNRALSDLRDGRRTGSAVL
jgi:hypothetical protein